MSVLPVKRGAHDRRLGVVGQVHTFGVGVSGAKVTVGLVEIKGMALATVVALLTSLLVWAGGVIHPPR